MTFRGPWPVYSTSLVAREYGLASAKAPAGLYGAVLVESAKSFQPISPSSERGWQNSPDFAPIWGGFAGGLMLISRSFEAN